MYFCPSPGAVPAQVSGLQASLGNIGQAPGMHFLVHLAMSLLLLCCSDHEVGTGVVAGG